MDIKVAMKNGRACGLIRGSRKKWTGRIITKDLRNINIVKRK